jgi:hypothetical protein
MPSKLHLTKAMMRKYQDIIIHIIAQSEERDGGGSQRMEIDRSVEQ